MRHLVNDLQSRLDRETARRERLEQRAVEAAEAFRAGQVQFTAAEARADAAERELAALERQEGAECDAAMLSSRRVLYVGGRPSAIQRMRDMLDDAGGLMLIHDGGRHDHPSLLPGLVGQADIVVFPVDCVSQDAALTIKTIDEVIERANKTSFGLGSGLWTKDVTKAHQLARGIRAGRSGSTVTRPWTRPCRSAATR